MPGRSSSRTCFAVRGNAESVRIPHGSPVGPTPFSGSARTSFHTCATTERVSTCHNEVRERTLPRGWTAHVLHDNVTWSMWRLRKRSSLARLKGSAPFLLLPFFALWFGTLPMFIEVTCQDGKKNKFSSNPVMGGRERRIHLRIDTQTYRQFLFSN